MELNSSCNLNIIGTSMKSKNPLSDLFITNIDPTLSAVNINEDTNDGTQLMMYQTNNQLSLVDVNTCRIPLLAVPNGSSTVLDTGNSCEKLEQEFIQHEEVVSDIVKQCQVSNSLVIIDDTSRNDPPASSQTFLLIDNFDDMNEHICDEQITEINQTIRNDLPESSQSFVLIDNNFDGIINEMDQNEDKDEITMALLSLGINQEYFITSGENDNTKKQQLWSCPIFGCDFRSVKLNNFKIHLLKHFDYRPFKCKLKKDNTNCKWAFFSRKQLQRHIDDVHKERKYTCDQCMKRFSSKSSLTGHLARHDKTVLYQCLVENCGGLFNTMALYNSHLKQHIELPAPFKCEHPGCDRRFYRVSSLQSHRRAHVNDPEDLICKVCHKQFRAPCRLKEHYSSVHDNIRKFKCTYEGCKWTFSANSKLTRHIQNTHLNIRKFECLVPDCGKTYLRSEHLQEHVRTHSENKPKFTCPYQDCLISFNCKSSLYAHLKHFHPSDKSTELLD
uniref:Zinc finger protein ZXDC n=1 Tax=Cacopsylla melanoneura TaxID=428564 RepID=A0A8D8W1V0_9HEMI